MRDRDLTTGIQIFMGTGEQVLGVLLQRGSRFSCLLALNKQLAELNRRCGRLQLDWSSVGVGNLAYCLEAGLARRLVCRIALFNRDLDLLQTARAQGMPFGNLLNGLGSSTEGAAPLITWASQQGWRPSLRQLFKLLWSLKDFEARDLPILSVKADFKALSKLFDERFNLSTNSKHIINSGFKTHCLLRDFCYLERAKPGAIGWFVDLMKPKEPNLYFVLMSAIAKRHSVPDTMISELAKADHFNVLHNTLSVACHTRDSLLYYALVQRCQQARSLESLLRTSISFGLSDSDWLQAVWVLAGSRELTARHWQLLWLAPSIGLIQWMRATGLEWDEGLIRRIIELDKSDLLEQVEQLGCPIPPKPSGFSLVTTPLCSCPQMLALFTSDERWHHWLPVLPLRSAIDAGRLDWLQLLIDRGVVVTVEAVSRCIQVGRYDMFEALLNAKQLVVGQQVFEPRSLHENLAQLVKMAEFWPIFAWFPNLSVAALRCATQHPVAKRLIVAWIRHENGQVQWLRSRKCRQHAKILLDAGLLKHAKLQRGYLPLGWIGDRFERLECCVERGLQIYDNDLEYFARRGALSIVQTVFSLITRIINERDLPMMDKWFSHVLITTCGELSIGALQSIAGQWLHSIKEASYFSHDRGLQEWAINH